MKQIYSTIIILLATIQFAAGQGGPGDLPADVSNTSQTVSPSDGQNYILTYSYLKPFTSHPATLLTGDASPEIQYFDGLGRPVQAVSVRATTSGAASNPVVYDLVTYQAYDAYGRADTTFMPYAKSSGNGAYTDKTSFKSGQNTFLTSVYGTTDGSKGYAVTGYENSPLNRVVKQGAPGVSWQLNAHPVQYAYKTNVVSQSWRYSGDSYSSFNYAAGSLYMKQTTDEDGNIVKEYTDFEGKVVRKVVNLGSDSLITRYCYDDFGLLRCVIQPMGSSPADTKYCFYYKYDSRKRMAKKSVPGGGRVYFIYDARDRLVLTQDSNQWAKTPDEWTYSVYDNLNRLTETGTWGTATERATLVSTMESSDNLNYISNITTKKPKKYLHYSNYTNLPSANVYYSTDATTLGVTQATNNTGRLTWTETKALNYETGMDTVITSAIYYDKYGRVIQTVTGNHLGGIDYITNKYNFAGQAVRTYHRHVADGVTTIIDQSFIYDHRGRLMKTYYTVGGTQTLVAANRYNGQGMLVNKYLHSQNSGNFIQKTDYRYNIRGWLKKINDPVSFSENDKFGLQLFYDSIPSGGSARYNGNIAVQRWGTPGYTNMQYNFTYDGANRLTSADFNKTGYSTTAFDCTYAYNKNGNHTSLTRRKSDGAYIDQLTFTNNGNYIRYADDNTRDVANIVDYPGTYSGNMYEYDYNGNMDYESAKEIDFTYNLLNLPKEADFGSNQKISYFYTFDGEKLRQTVEDNGTITKVDYCGPFVYETTSGVRSLKYFVTPEGRAVKNGTTWDYEYNLEDHLGNTRAVIRDSSGVVKKIQERHYYPFGMEMSELSSGSSTNKYLYNGKEHQGDLDWYDYGARFYDPGLGRFHSVDPLAEKHAGLSPYAYCANNPMRFIDPTGMEFTESAWEQVNRLIEDINKRQAKNAASIGEKQAQISAGGLSEKQVTKLQKQIDRLNNNTSELEGTRGEIATLAASNQMYDIKSDNSMNINGAIPGTGETRSGAAFNFNNGNFELTLGDGSLGMLSHELKHAYQFETGAFSSGYNRFGIPFYDKTDEFEAYSRGALFGGERINTLPSLYDDLQNGPMDVTKLAPITLSNPAELQKIADRTRSAFRVNGVTYIMQGGK